ncbi:MAG: CoA-binding protein [Desulfatiglans sp.]|nr:CoA-binding protein [Desulfatiglans sp.]
MIRNDTASLQESARFFEPRSIAVIGSPREAFFGGYVVVKSLVSSGYKGRIYPVNPGCKDILGIRAYASIKEVDGEIDAALIMINARRVPQVLKECGEKGVKAVTVVSDGFAERNGEGVRLQQEILEIARQSGIRMIGPNTVGVVNTANGYNPCPYAAGSYYTLKAGPVAISSQTGMTNPQAFPYMDFNIGVSKICDFGNKCDLDECDLLLYLDKDPATKVASMYVESVRDGKRFLETARKVTKHKPVCILKSGRTLQGAKASASHTGSIAVDDRIFDSLCRQAGILRLNKWHELFDVPKIFAHQPLPRGNRIGIVSYTGGVGVLATDEGAKYGLEPATLTPGTSALLEEVFPGFGKTPVDIGPVAPAVPDFFTSFPRILEAVIGDDQVDALLMVIWADPTSNNNTEACLEAYERLRRTHQKPVATWIYGPEVSMARDLANQLEDMGYPVFSDSETAVKALGLAFHYSQFRESYERNRTWATKDKGIHLEGGGPQPR